MSQHLTTPEGRRLAYDRTEGRGPGVVFLGGFKSDKEGTKALALEAWARAEGRAFLRFDYSGHGSSSGDFLNGAIGDWFEDARAAILTLTEGPQVLVGSSMGGWIALLLAARLRQLIEDGRNHLVLRTPLTLPFPVRFLQGTADTDVPVSVALRLMDHARGSDMRLTLVKGADHRFSTPDCLRLIETCVRKVVART